MFSKTLAAGAARKWMGLFALASLAALSTQASAQSEQQDLVNAAETTFTNFVRDPDMSWLQQHIGIARGVLFVRNDQTGRWEGPAFYNLATASVGFQAGVAVSESVMLIMTEKGINSLLADSVKIGGDV